jgi:hypothetical protein
MAGSEQRLKGKFIFSGALCPKVVSEDSCLPINHGFKRVLPARESRQMAFLAFFCRPSPALNCHWHGCCYIYVKQRQTAEQRTNGIPVIGGHLITKVKEYVIMAKVQKSTDSSSLAEVVDRILDKGIVIDAWVKVSLVGIELLSIEARVVIASVETYLKYAEAIGLTASAAAPA